MFDFGEDTPVQNEEVLALELEDNERLLPFSRQASTSSQARVKTNGANMEGRASTGFTGLISVFVCFIF